MWEAEVQQDETTLEINHYLRMPAPVCLTCPRLTGLCFGSSWAAHASCRCITLKTGMVGASLPSFSALLMTYRRGWCAMSAMRMRSASSPTMAARGVGLGCRQGLDGVPGQQQSEGLRASGL